MAYLRVQIISCSVQLRTYDILNLDRILASAPSNDLFEQGLSLQTELNLMSIRHIENLINKMQSRTDESGEKAGKNLDHQLHQKTLNGILAEINELGTKHRDHLQADLFFHKFYYRISHE